MSNALSVAHRKHACLLRKTLTRLISPYVSSSRSLHTSASSFKTPLCSPSSSSSSSPLHRLGYAGFPRDETRRLLAAFLVPPSSTFATTLNARQFKTRAAKGIGKSTSTSRGDANKKFDIEELIFGEKSTASTSSSSSSSSSSSGSSSSATTLSTPSGLSESEQKDFVAALSTSRRKSISGLLKKYKRQPDVQQQLKIAFADGYSYAEQKSTGKDSKQRKGPMSIFSYMGDMMWWVVGLWLLVHTLNELRHIFGGGDGLSRGLFNALGPYEVNPEEILVTFADVKGVDEAKDELQDVVEFLRDPERFSSLGGKMPHGVLLVGEPGVGKTLLAKAVAGEAGVPFFQAAGSEFDEIFVGTGAKRVRQLFTSAKERAPAVIFIDEIDSVGGKRTSSPGHPYANQTINMLLSEMDGFEKNEGVIVIGATNKRDNLDKALIRPGRFDVEVTVYPPDVKARKELFDLYIAKILCDYEVDTMILAKDTRGFVGADIDNMVNQAAIRAGKLLAESVTMEHLNWARDKVSMGPEKKSKIPDEKVNWNTSLHEAGHALVAYHTPAALPIRKVTIMPRGPALGYVEQTPKDVMTNRTKVEMLAEVDVAMGGKVAEELAQGNSDVTPGCSSDLDKATNIARSMVLHYGMSSKLGVRTINSQEEYESLSNATKTQIDAEIRAIADAAYKRAENILIHHKTEHLRLAEALMKYETLDAEDVDVIAKGQTLVKKDLEEKGESNGQSGQVFMDGNLLQ